MQDFIEDKDWKNTAPDILKADRVFVNDIYQVNLAFLESKENMDWFLHLSIKRLDKKDIHDWRDLQIIKNKIVGEEREAVEIYPAESRLVDSSNQYHLWVFPKGEKVPFGYTDRLIMDEKIGGFQKVGQRKFNDDEKPKDITSEEDYKKMAEKAGLRWNLI